MAKSDNVKGSPPKEPQKPANKAQAEFERYKAAAAQAQGGFAHLQGQPVLPYPGAFPQAGTAGPYWAYPPSLAMLPQGPAPGAGYPGAARPAAPYTDQIGTTLRLGVDALNAVLVGGIRILTGFSAYGAGEHGYSHSHSDCGCGGGCGCGCSSCCDPCETKCGYDCCCAFGETCCQPSVGTCC